MRVPYKSLTLLAAALLLSVATAASAQAPRFGKSGGGRAVAPARPAPAGSYHGAAPVGRGYPGGGGYRQGPYRNGYGGYGYARGVGYPGYAYSGGYAPYGYPYAYEPPGYVRYGWGFGYYPLFWGASAPESDSYELSVSRAPYRDGAAPVVTSFGAQVQDVRQGGIAVGLQAGVEGTHWGFTAQTNSLFVVSSTPDLNSVDAIHLVYLHGTYALIASPYGRLRLEAGADSAFAPNLTALGPGLGVSGAMGLFGPLSVEGAVHYTPLPFTQLDWNAGLSLGLGPVGLRVGWRHTWLNDNGMVDRGIAHEDVFSGPYAGVSVAL